jgi:hypothetical protein
MKPHKKKINTPRVIIEQLVFFSGNVVPAAKSLKLHPSNFRRLMRTHHIRVVQADPLVIEHGAKQTPCKTPESPLPVRALPDSLGTRSSP